MGYVYKFYTADTHFGHGNIIGMCKRPFEDVYEMDRVLIENWNAVVKSDDHVYHLGDFAFSLGDEARIQAIFKQLNGHKHLVIGNHDECRGNIHPTIAALGWASRPEYMMSIDDGQRVVLCHYALRTWPGFHKGAIHFYGHSHGSMEPFARARDVGVDMSDTGYAPRTLKQLLPGISFDEVVAA